LVAKAEMSAPEISAMENKPRNLTIGTFIRGAHALGTPSMLRVKRGGGGMAEERSKPAAFRSKAAALDAQGFGDSSRSLYITWPS
jgi:hypothetical protein